MRSTLIALLETMDISVTADVMEKSTTRRNAGGTEEIVMSSTRSIRVAKSPIRLTLGTANVTTESTIQLNADGMVETVGDR